MPRPRRPNLSSAAIGTAAGAALAGLPGAVAGALLGVAAGESPVPLEEALAEACRERELRLVSVRRLRRNEVTVVFSSGRRAYWSVSARAAVRSADEADALDDELFDRVIAELDSWVARRDA